MNMLEAYRAQKRANHAGRLKRTPDEMAAKARAESAATDARIAAQRAERAAKLAAIPERRCVAASCGAVLVPRSNECPAHFAIRQACDVICANAARREAKASAALSPVVAPVTVDRRCRCGTTLVRRPRETPKQFAARDHCSNTCAAKARLATKRANEAANPTPKPNPWPKRRPVPPRPVESPKAVEVVADPVAPPRLCPCGQPIVRAEGERWEAFANRSHCSEACAPPKPEPGAEVYLRRRDRPITWQAPAKEAPGPSASVQAIREQIVAMLGARDLSLEAVRRSIVEVDGSASSDFTEALIALVASEVVERFTLAGWARLRLTPVVR